MMRLLGVRPIDIISTTIMTTTLNGSLPASSDCIAPSQPPALCRYWPPAAPAAAAARRGEIQRPHAPLAPAHSISGPSVQCLRVSDADFRSGATTLRSNSRLPFLVLAGGGPCSSSPAWRILTAPRSSGASSFDPGANSGLPETACRPLLLALAHGSPSSSSPPWGHLMPPRPYRASSFNLGSSTTTLPAPCGAPSASCGRGAGCCALLLAVAMATATGTPTPTPTPTPHATPRLLVIRYMSGLGIRLYEQT